MNVASFDGLCVIRKENEGKECECSAMKVIEIR